MGLTVSGKGNGFEELSPIIGGVSSDGAGRDDLGREWCLSTGVWGAGERTWRGGAAQAVFLRGVVARRCSGITGAVSVLDRLSSRRVGFDRTGGSLGAGMSVLGFVVGRDASDESLRKNMAAAIPASRIASERRTRRSRFIGIAPKLTRRMIDRRGRV